MSHLDPGPLADYNSLVDPNLIGYFNNTKMRKHLRKAGLITRKGEIISETTYRLNMAQKEHKKHVRDMLAQAIVHRALEMERGRQTQIRKKLEEISKIELVQRVRNERARRGDEEVLPYLSPVQPRSRRSSSAPSIQSQKRRPVSAPSGGPNKYPIHIDARAPVSPKKSHKQKKNRDEMIAPAPPKSPPSGSNTPRRWLKVPHDSQGKPFKMSNRGSLALHRGGEPTMPHQIQLNSNCKVKMHYHGSNIHLDYEKFDPRDHITVEQQHCGGNTLNVFREKIEPGTDFEFISKRHHGYPFSLTLYVDGVKDSRVSACCEYRHRMGLKLGSKLGHFSIINISGASPCHKCDLEKKFKKEKPKKKPPPPKEDEKEIIGLGNEKGTGSAKYKVSVEEEVVYSSDHETYTDEQTQQGEADFEEDENLLEDEEIIKFELGSVKSDDEEEEEGEAVVIAVEDEESGRSVQPAKSDNKKITSPPQFVMVSATTDDTSSYSSDSESDSSSVSDSSDSEEEYSDESFEEDDSKNNEKVVHDVHGPEGDHFHIHVPEKSSDLEKEVKYHKAEDEIAVVEMSKNQNETEGIIEEEAKTAESEGKILESIAEEEIINGKDTEKESVADQIEEVYEKPQVTNNKTSKVTSVQDATEIVEELNDREKSKESKPSVFEDDLKVLGETETGASEKDVENGKNDNVAYESATFRSDSSYTSASSTSSAPTSQTASKTELNNTTVSEKNNAKGSEKNNSATAEVEIANAVEVVKKAEVESVTRQEAAYDSDTFRSESSYTSSSSASSTATSQMASKTDMNADLDSTTNVVTNSERNVATKTENEVANVAKVVEIAEAEKEERSAKQESSPSGPSEEQIVKTEKKKLTEEETKSPHSGFGEDTLKMEVADEMQKLLQDNNDREGAISPRSDSSESRSSGSMTSGSSSFVTDAETEDKQTALQKKQ